MSIVIQYTLFDFIGSSTMEVVDLRTSAGKARYRELFGRLPKKKYQKEEDTLKKDITFLNSVYNERDKRLFAGFLARAFKNGGVSKAAQITGLCRKTVRRGKKELKGRDKRLKCGIRRKGGGRPSKAESEPRYEEELQKLIKDDVAGDPMSGHKWVRKTLRWMRNQLHYKQISTSIGTIWRTLKKFGISLRQNVKTVNRRDHPDRDTQFQYLNKFKNACIGWGVPVISIDAKKKEYIGNFKNKGRIWRKDPRAVLDHDFPSLGKGIFIPYGVYDLQEHDAHVYCGTSHETSDFAVDCIVQWWETYGQVLYPNCPHLLILCDSGGSNGYRRRLWKRDLQIKLADRFGLHVYVCHYPSGASKYNPIERKVFSFISLNWAGQPLTSYPKALDLIKSTSTKTGLTVNATLVEKEYETGIKVSNKEMKSLQIKHSCTCPQWNYCISPR
ncbi:MAG: ISAzo13 family transposase [Promethearchaeia archaeon]